MQKTMGEISLFTTLRNTENLEMPTSGHNFEISRRSIPILVHNTCFIPAAKLSIIRFSTGKQSFQSSTFLGKRAQSTSVQSST